MGEIEIRLLSGTQKKCAIRLTIKYVKYNYYNYARYKTIVIHYMQLRVIITSSRA